MAYRNEVQPLNLFGDFLAGQQASNANTRAQQVNALGNIQVQQGQRVNALASNPDATPEQYIRAGDTAGGVALGNEQQSQQVDKQQALGQLAGIAQKALTITDPVQRKSFLQQAGQVYGSSFRAMGADMTQFPAMLAMPDDQLQAKLQQVAQFAAPPKPIEVGKDASLVVPDQANPGGYKAAYISPASTDVTFHDAGGELVPTLKNGQIASGVPPIKKTPTPTSQLTQGDYTDAGMALAVQDYINTGKLPRGAAAQSKVQNAAAQYMADNGKNAEAETMRRQSRQRSLLAFTSGTESRTVRSLNVAVSHLDVLEKLGGALNNGDTQVINQLSNWWKTQTGNPAPTTFNAIKQIVGQEVVKAVVANGGGQGEREEAAANIASKNSPDQLAGAVQGYKALFGGQLGGLKQQYEEGTGQKDFERFVSPEARQYIPSAGTAPAAVQSPATTNGWTVQKVQ